VRILGVVKKDVWTVRVATDISIETKRVTVHECE